MRDFKDEVWNIDGITIPVRIHREWRNNHRISITGDKVIIRAAKWAHGRSSSIKPWAIEWLKHQFATQEDLASRFKSVLYRDNDVVVTTRKKYVLRMKIDDRKTNTGILHDGEIHLKLSRVLGNFERKQLTSSLISRVISKDQFPAVSSRIRELNRQHFGFKVGQIRIKNNRSNWGSCSCAGNINIASRALLTPLPVQDYIFIHELAHLKELNHSKAYWSLVNEVVPDYKVFEEWLKSEGRYLRF